MRARNLKPGFFKNEDLASIEPLGRILFEGLWCMADRKGKLEDRPLRIKAEVLPYDNCDVECLLVSLHSKHFINRYEIKGCKYIEIINFLKHQTPHWQERDSVIPSPDSTKRKPRVIQDKSKINPSDILTPDILTPDILTPDSKASQDKFEIFWKSYPKKKNKGDAEKAWKKIVPSDGLFKKIISKIGEAKSSREWIKDGGQFIPYPASWINAKGWEDEYSEPMQVLSIEDKWMVIKEEQDQREKLKDGKEGSGTIQIGYEQNAGKYAGSKS